MSKRLTVRPKAGRFASTEAEKRSVACLQYRQNHAMADGHEFHFLRLAQPVRRHGDRRGDIGDFFLAILPIDQRRAFACLRPHVRPRTNSVNLPFEQASECVRT